MTDLTIQVIQGATVARVNGGAIVRRDVSPGFTARVRGGAERLQVKMLQGHTTIARVRGGVESLRVQRGQVVLRGPSQGPPGPGGDLPFVIQAFEDVAIGQPVFVRAGDGQIELAQANGLLASQVFGVVSAAALAGFAASVRTIGRVEVLDWSAITGATLLTRGADYYLHATTAGMLTTTAPQTAGQFVTRVGRAATTTVLDVHPHRSIRKA